MLLEGVGIGHYEENNMAQVKMEVVYHRFRLQQVDRIYVWLSYKHTHTHTHTRLHIITRE